MNNRLELDYYYGVESEQFTFYRVPRILMKDERFKGLSSDAKLLYGLMLDRMSLSMKNGWIDDNNRAYIIYTIDNIMEDFGCASAKAVKILAELGTAKGIGLIEKVRRGMGKPDIIYVKNFATIKDTDNLEKEEKEPETNDNTKNFENQNSRVLKNEIQEFRKSKFKSFENQNSRISEIENQEFRKSKCNYTNNNYTEYSYTDINHINHIKDKNDDDKNDNTNETDNLVFLIKKNIDYEHHMKYDDYGKRSLFDELFKVVCDIVCVKREKVRIEKEDYPYELVKSKFLKLDGSHLEYVIDSMQKTTSKIGNLKQYMITALYNAQNTINHHYQQEVRFDEYELE